MNKEVGRRLFWLHVRKNIQAITITSPSTDHPWNYLSGGRMTIYKKYIQRVLTRRKVILGDV